ncbi:MAG TPA: transglycosylase domain-containing protein, partial [Myxococcaceae bacterium]|nr:transglycosylase domain-containing protein [Myxococcaceae bacterium]
MTGLWGLLVAATAGITVFLGLYYAFSEGLPDIPSVERYWPATLTEVYTDDAVLAGEFYEQRRKVVSYDRIPKRLVQAFIASEDSSFFDHFGVDLVGTSRAALKTFLRKATGSGSVQGGSTLTQQTAKAVLIGFEGYKKATQKSLTRKIREAILALRLEKALTKEEILYLYLNNVYLGHHSYGVQSAAENYYRKDVKDLSLAEMALIAGLPQAPSKYSPFRAPEAAKARRGYVLRRMLDEGMISRAEFDEANKVEVKVYPVEDVFHEFAPSFVEEVRRTVVDRYGNDRLLNQGLKVFTTMDSERQRTAQEALLDGLLTVDKRQGYRGPVLQLTTPEAQRSFIARSKKAMGGEAIQENRLYVGLVTAIDESNTLADVRIGAHTGKLPLLGMRWARKVNPEGYYPGLMLNGVRPTVRVGDVLVLRAVSKKNLTDDNDQFDRKLANALPEGEQLFRLEQEPELQGALVSIDPHRQYLVAMVGGYDFDANEYNRAFQACRQPGSAYKPIVYAAALEQLNWTEATVIVDSPVVFDDEESQLRWKPQNFSEEFVGDVLLRTALVNSMNIPAVKTFQAVGVKNMAAWAKTLGLSTKMNEDFSAALGSSCVYPFELAQVYATFNRYGRKKPTYFIRKIEDRFGRTLEDHTAYDDAWAPLQDRVAAGYARL